MQVARNAAIQEELQAHKNWQEAAHNRRELDLTLRIYEKTTRARSGSGADVDYDMENFPWSSRMDRYFRKTFKMIDYKPSQRAICNADIAGCNIFGILPTGAFGGACHFPSSRKISDLVNGGGGKSLTFQLPASLKKGCTLVIQPLVRYSDEIVGPRV